MSDEQAVVDKTKEQDSDPASAEVVSAQKEQEKPEEQVDLDALLNEWGKTDEPKKPDVKETVSEEKGGANDGRIDDVIEYVRAQRIRDEEMTRRQVEDDYKKTVASLKGDLPLSEKVVDGYLRIRAAEDPRILAAYQGRNDNPDVWRKIETGIRNEIKKELGSLPDSAVTDTRKQIASAIQSAQSMSGEVERKSFGQLSDMEFQQELSKILNS